MAVTELVEKKGQRGHATNLDKDIWSEARGAGDDARFKKWGMTVKELLTDPFSASLKLTAAARTKNRHIHLI